MTWRRALALGSMLAASASPVAAQTVPVFTRDGTSATGPAQPGDAIHLGQMEGFFGLKVDTINGVLTAPRINGGIVDQTSTVTPQGALNAQTFSKLAYTAGAHPDWNKTTADGADDAPSIQRTINAICSGLLTNVSDMRFYSRHYALNSAITQPCPVNWRGQGYDEEVGAVYTGAGTWFDIGTSFVGGTTPPITLTAGAYGSIFEDFGMDEPGQTAPPAATYAYPTVASPVASAASTTSGADTTVAVNSTAGVGTGTSYLVSGTGVAAGAYVVSVTDATHMVITPASAVSSGATLTVTNQRITGWSPSTWAPANYPYVISLQTVPGVLARHLMLNGLTNGITSVGSGRANFYDIRGQVFQAMITVDQAYDVSRIVDIHTWTYWASSDPVMNYAQANSVAVLSYRSDTPFWDRIFAFGVKAGVEIATSASGTTTGASVGTLSCDFAEYCLWLNDTTTGSQITAQVASIRSYSQVWNTVYGAAVTMLPGSAPVEYDGAAIVQLGSIENFGSDSATFNFTNTVAPSNMTYNSAFIHENQMSPNSYMAKFPTSGTGSLVTGATPPLLAGTVSGFELTNTGTNGSGTGTLQYNVPTVAH